MSIPCENQKGKLMEIMVLADQNWLGNTSNFCGLRLLQLRLATISSSASPSSEIHGTQDRWWSSIAEVKKTSLLRKTKSCQTLLNRIFGRCQRHLDIKKEKSVTSRLTQAALKQFNRPLGYWPEAQSENFHSNVLRVTELTWARITYCYKVQLTQLMRKLRPKLGVSEWYVFTFLFVSGSQFFNDLNTTTNR